MLSSSSYKAIRPDKKISKQKNSFSIVPTFPCSVLYLIISFWISVTGLHFTSSYKSALNKKAHKSSAQKANEWFRIPVSLRGKRYPLWGMELMQILQPQGWGWVVSFVFPCTFF